MGRVFGISVRKQYAGGVLQVSCGKEVGAAKGKYFHYIEQFAKIRCFPGRAPVCQLINFALLVFGKKSTGLSEHQAELLKRFYARIPDEQIQKELSIGSKSTIRNHRFVLKEKERQARIFMTLMQLIRDNETYPGKYIKPHSTGTMVDDRYKVTVAESEKLLKKYFPDGLDGPLKTFTMKEKAKVVVLRHISQRFEPQIKYSEKQVDEILKAVFADHVTLRRYLIEYGFLDRTKDCSQYWLKS
jgi:hypothetical protein